MFDTPESELAAPPSRPIDRRRAETRREIVDAAWSLCREHGLAGLSLRELAARVGMRAPSLYSYFASKDDIYDAMFTDGQRSLAAQLAELPALAASADPGTARRHLKAGIRTFFDFCVADSVRYQLLFQRTIPGFEPSAESYSLALRNLETMQRHLADAGIRDAAHLDLWSAMVTGLTAQQISNDPGGTRWAVLIDDAVDALCEHAGLTTRSTT